MKIIIILFMFTILLSGCNNKNVVASNTDAAIYVGNYKDCTAEITNCIEISDNASYSQVKMDACFSHIYKNISDLYPDAENIVEGTVIEITYSDENASAATYCTFAVDEVLKGSKIEKNSLITVAAFQGFCRISQYVEIYGNDHFPKFDLSNADAMYFVYAFDGEPLIQTGEKFVLFLSPQQENETIIGSYYIPIGTYMGRYKLNNEGYYERYSPRNDTYAITNGNTRNGVEIESPMTLDEIREAVRLIENNQLK
ncbi:MAG: hypothetical protein PUF12_02090 [Thermoflexaceae bacterium]|nr:hypothetical protein [Thermoflexaceae bacterium]